MAADPFVAALRSAWIAWTTGIPMVVRGDDTSQSRPARSHGRTGRVGSTHLQRPTDVLEELPALCPCLRMVSLETRRLRPHRVREGAPFAHLDRKALLMRGLVLDERRISRERGGMRQPRLETRDVVHGHEEPAEERPDGVRPVVPPLWGPAATEDRRR